MTSELSDNDYAARKRSRRLVSQNWQYLSAIAFSPLTMIASTVSCMGIIASSFIMRAMSLIAAGALIGVVVLSSLTLLEGSSRKPALTDLPVINNYSGRSITPLRSKTPILRSVEDLTR